MNADQIDLLTLCRKSMAAAQILLTHDLFDSVANQAYYAMFYAVQALLLEKGLAFSKHGNTIGAFGQHFVKTGLFRPELHQHLHQAFDKRATADYDLTKRVTDLEAVELVKHAEEFIEAAETWLNQERKEADQ